MDTVGSSYRKKKQFSRKQFILQEISFALEPGYIMGIVGKNGAGKTTLFKYLMERNAVYSGKIYYRGTEIHERHTEFLQQVGFVSEDNIFLMDKSARQNGELFGTFYEAWDEALFAEQLKRFDVPARQPLKALSRGEYIKFQMAFAIGHHPGLYLLDEATAGMDPIYRREFFKVLRELMATEEASVILSTQIPSDLERGVDYIGVMEQGRMISFRENMGEMDDEEA